MFIDNRLFREFHTTSGTGCARFMGSTEVIYERVTYQYKEEPKINDKRNGKRKRNPNRWK